MPSEPFAGGEPTNNGSAAELGGPSGTREKVPTPSADISGRLHRPLLRVTGWLWASYLVSWSPICFASDFVRGVAPGFLVLPLIFGTTAAGVAVWASLRVRRAAYYWAAVAALPLAALCWWHVLYWPLPGRM
ncbi:MAG TPA: hypothetical protein VGE74_04660 [Gemmata sp.]